MLCAWTTFIPMFWAKVLHEWSSRDASRVCPLYRMLTKQLGGLLVLSYFVSHKSIIHNILLVIMWWWNSQQFALLVLLSMWNPSNFSFFLIFCIKNLSHFEFKLLVFGACKFAVAYQFVHFQITLSWNSHRRFASSSLD